MRAVPRRSPREGITCFAMSPARASIVTRAGDGAVHAFYNVCRHRGTRLCETGQGCFDGTVRCPYHAWAYDLTGQLVAAPQMDDVANFRKQDYPLVAVAVDFWDGHMFLNLGEAPRPLAAQLGVLPDRFRAWGMDQLRMARRVVYDVASNWKLIIQNYSECLHCPGVHPRSSAFLTS